MMAQVEQEKEKSGESVGGSSTHGGGGGKSGVGLEPKSPPDQTGGKAGVGASPKTLPDSREPVPVKSGLSVDPKETG